MEIVVKLNREQIKAIVVEAAKHYVRNVNIPSDFDCDVRLEPYGDTTVTITPRKKADSKEAMTPDEQTENATSKDILDPLGSRLGVEMYG